MVYRIFLATALIISNVSLYYLSISLISLLHGAQRRSYGFVKRPGLFRSEKPHAGSRGRSSLARHRVKGATMKALKKLKVCLRTSATEEELPLFHIRSTGFEPSMDPHTKASNQSAHHKHVRGFSSAHSWPPVQQSVKRFTSDLDFLFTLPAASELPRVLPGDGPVPRLRADARTGRSLDAPAPPAELEVQRSARELRRALRAMYRTRFQLASELSESGARSAIADALYSLTPSAAALRAELLARGVMPQPPSSSPGRDAGDAEGALLSLPAKPVAPPPAAFLVALSCPPEFWGQDDDEALLAWQQSKSLDFLLDALVDMSVAALICPGSSADAAAGGVALEGWPAAMRSPFEQRGVYAVRDMAAVPDTCAHPMATLQEV